MPALPSTIVVAAATVGVIATAAWPVIRPWLERLVNKRLDLQFAKRLEDHKHDLEVLTESARYGFQKRLANVTLQISRRHDAYVEVYRASRIAHGLLINQRGLRQVPTFEEYNADDAEAYLQVRGAPKGFIDEVRRMWASERDAAIKRMEPYARMLDLQGAENAFTDAKNKTFANELYFSVAVVECCNQFIDAGSAVLLDLKYPTRDHAKWDGLSQAFTEKLEALHDAMHAELAAE